MKSPLILGNDLSQMVSAQPAMSCPYTHRSHLQTSETLDIITNDAIIAANQDSLGAPAKRLWKRGDLQLWAGPLAGGCVERMQSMIDVMC